MSNNNNNNNINNNSPPLAENNYIASSSLGSSKLPPSHDSYGTNSNNSNDLESSRLALKVAELKIPKDDWNGLWNAYLSTRVSPYYYLHKNLLSVRLFVC
jgi:hypothetical protein